MNKDITNNKATDNMGVFASWNLQFYEGRPFIADMHYPYIQYLCENFRKVVVVSSSKDVGQRPTFIDLSKLDNLEIVRLPYLPRYVDAIKHVRTIIKRLREAMSRVDVMYCRVPDPLCWCPAVLFKKRVIMDFIGDTIDCTIHNEKWNWFRKVIMIAGYYPEYRLTLKAAKKSVKVVTAGDKLALKLKKHGINAVPLVPSLLSEKDIPNDLRIIKYNAPIKLVYVGYIRYAKGIYTLMEVCKQLKAFGVDFDLNVIGVGELFEELEQFVAENGFDNIHLLGFLESRDDLNRIMYSSDLFIFPSLSEGAPRVVIEAMAHGVPVVSTPVGALPYMFRDKETIRFFDYNDAGAVVEIIKGFIGDAEPFVMQRNKAYEQVKNNYTKEKFFEQVFKL